MDIEEKNEIHIESIKKLIDKLYATVSLNAENNYTEELIKEAKKVEINSLIEFSKTLDIFGKCVLHYKLPIDMRLIVDLSKSTEVNIEDRLSYWKDYKEKLKTMNKGPEEEYDKKILMACILHVPIEDDENVDTTKNDSIEECSDVIDTCDNLLKD